MKTKAYLMVLLALLILGLVSGIYGYSDTIYRLDRANALFNRGETAGYAEEFIDYVRRGQQLLPRDGNPVWWFPTDRTDFSLIHKDISSILSRAQILTTVQRNSDAYQQGMDDVRDKIRIIELQITDAAPYLLASIQNLLFSAVWFVIEVYVFLNLLRIKRRVASLEKAT